MKSDIEKFTQIYLNLISEANDKSSKKNFPVTIRISKRYSDLIQKINNEDDKKEINSKINQFITDFKGISGTSGKKVRILSILNTLKESLSNLSNDLQTTNIKKYLGSVDSNEEEKKEPKSDSTPKDKPLKASTEVNGNGQAEGQTRNQTSTQ